MFTADRQKEGKLVSESSIINRKISLFADDCDPNGIFFGGRILQLVESIAKEVADKHSEIKCVMEGIDFVRFISTAKREDILLCSAFVNRTWDHISEIGIKVVAEDFRMLEKKNVLYAFFYFAAYDIDKNPYEVSYIIPQSVEEEKRFAEAEKRRQFRGRS